MRSQPHRRPEACELCGRSVPELTRHHLIPRRNHRLARYRRRHDLAELRGRVAWLCRPCHDQVHVLLDEKELAEDYDTVDKLATHPGVARFVAWVRKRPASKRIR